MTKRFWNAHDGTCLTVLQGHTGGVMSVSFSPNGQILAIAKTPRSDCGVLIRHHPQNLARTLLGKGCLQPDGQILASGSEDHDSTMEQTQRAYGLGHLTQL